MTANTTTCPNCGSHGCEVFYSVSDAPVHSVVMVRDREAAKAYPTGRIDLAYCGNCGFVFNAAFDAALQDYRHDYESTQAHSGTFNAFHNALADRLVERYALKDRKLVEIGCGQGEFLAMLCEKGGNRGLGFDPAYEPDRGVNIADVTVVKDYFSEDHGPLEADFICCKMTLEHISRTHDFVETVRKAISRDSSPVVFFQVPALRRILEEGAFWDIYYEHCSYFDETSLGHLFRDCGFEVTECRTEYDDQYLMVEARMPESSDGPTPVAAPAEDNRRLILDFARRTKSAIDSWREFLRGCAGRGERVAIWGGGSKAVAFLSAVAPGDMVDRVIDINPLKDNTFLAGSGHRCVTPDRLKERPADWIIVMNPIYMGEISDAVKALGLPAGILPVTAEASDILQAGQRADA